MRKYITWTLPAVALLFASAADAQYDAKLQAPLFKTKLVQAVDECASPTTIISGIGACAPTNADTDGTQFSVGHMIVRARINSAQVLTVLRSSPNAAVKAALGGLNVRTRLTVRVTRSTGVSTTWADFVLNCPISTVTGTGNIVMRSSLTGCGLPGVAATESFQREIVHAEVINADTGRAIAVPGVRKR
jgi:hypothetical protein